MSYKWYAPRVHGDGNGCFLSSAKVQKFCQSDKSRSCVERYEGCSRSVNGEGVLLTPVNIRVVNIFSRPETEVLTEGYFRYGKHLTLFNCT